MSDSMLRKIQVAPLLLALLPLVGLLTLLLRESSPAAVPEEDLVPTIAAGSTEPGVFHPPRAPTTSPRTAAAPPEGSGQEASAPEGTAPAEGTGGSP